MLEKNSNFINNEKAQLSALNKVLEEHRKFLKEGQVKSVLKKINEVKEKIKGYTLSKNLYQERIDWEEAVTKLAGNNITDIKLPWFYSCYTQIPNY